MKASFAGLAVAAAVMVAAASAPVATPPRTVPARPARKVEFGRDVRPILSQKCFRCHGPDGAVAELTGLRLDLEERAHADRGGYAAVVPGKPDASAMIARVTADEAVRMPPPDSGISPLTPEEVAVLRAWIEQGGKYEPHWAFVPPRAPEPPEVADPSWCRNFIDRFVLANLEAHGLEPEPEAERTTLGRRAALALTGLPLTPEETSAFLADKRTDAYERLVDRLLASPRYGEHQARYWLDAVRYGDTHGLHLDNERLAWPYRDWVVRAFNQDLPFDEFTVWQLAGDMLPQPTLDQLVASGYIRMNPTTNEGGAIEAEFLAKNTFDRVDTTSTVFLGVTMACARCHDHKYDPFSQADYFSLYAYFNSTAESPLDGNLLAPEPTVAAPSEEQRQAIADANAEARRLERAVDVEAALLWATTSLPEPPKAEGWQISGPYRAATFQAAFDTAFAPEPGGSGADEAWAPTEVLDDTPYAESLKVENAAYYLKATITVARAGKLSLSLATDDGVAVWLNGKRIHANAALRSLGQATDTVETELSPGPNALLVKVVNGPGTGGYRVTLADPRVRRLGELAGRAGPLSWLERREAARLFMLVGPETPSSARYRERVSALAALEASVPKALVAKELDEPRPAYVLRRGEYDQPTTPAPRRLPPALAGDHEPPKDRLGLARWLTAADNPLTARVFVNRVWQQHFGTGLVRTSEDFGNQGEWPSDRALLDALATDFAASGWSVKRLHRNIVTSAAFRQSSRLTPQKRETDPENRLASRGPRFRLDAEVLRDQALWAAGLLVERPGGQGDKPYQPPGLWEAIAFLESTTSRYVQDEGERLYRRSLYLFWKRTSPHPVMLTFDAPMREACTVRRSRTNTPLQALVTLNETGFFEAARVLADRLLAAEGTDRARVARLYQTLAGRQPEGAEADALLEALAAHRVRFAADPSAAARAVSVGAAPAHHRDPVELAAWTLVCNTVLNLDEVLSLN